MNFNILLLIIVFVSCVFLYWVVYNKTQNNFNNISNNLGKDIWFSADGALLTGNNNIPKIDDTIIRNPELLTSSMVYPEITIKEETLRKNRMDVLNKFYTNFDDDITSYKKVPRGQYITP